MNHVRNNTRFVLLILVLSGLAGFVPSAMAQKNYPPELPGSKSMTYKSVGDVNLKLWIYEPEGHNAATDRRPVVVFFFGGGWKAGSPQQFQTHCEYLASRGIIAATADYRVATRHGCKADACVEDTKSAIRWLRQNAVTLGIDANRICAAGGSAGGHTACCAGVISGFEAKGEDHDVSSKPNAMVLFNPAVMIAPLDGFDLSEISDEKYADIASRTGVPPQQISPIHHVHAELPPTIIFHGQADVTVPYATVEEYGRRATAAGNRCEVCGFADARHGFFNAGRGKTESEKEEGSQRYRRTLRKMDEFLHSLNWLDKHRPDHVVDEEFVTLRGPYENSFARFAKEKKGHVAFLGGSITEGNFYRPLVEEWLRKRFPDTDFQFTNAGISSTCSNTGAFRLSRDVLSQGPVDLLFVEFAVNDDQDAAHSAEDCIHGMEGIIRHTREHNPRVDIVMTHFVNPGMLKTLTDGNEILSASRHEQVARHYAVSSVFLPKALGARIADSRMTWKQFGGTHPKQPGNQLAAVLATSILDEAWRTLNPETVDAQPHATPAAAIQPTSFSAGQLLPPAAAKDTTGWEISVPEWDGIPGGKRERFCAIRLLHSATPGATAELDFDGTAVGVYVVAGPDAGQLQYQIDDGEWKTAELYHRYSKGLHYPRTVMFATQLNEGTHRLRLRLSAEHHQHSKGTDARIIGFTVNGATSE